MTKLNTADLVDIIVYALGSKFDKDTETSDSIADKIGEALTPFPPHISIPALTSALATEVAARALQTNQPRKEIEAVLTLTTKITTEKALTAFDAFRPISEEVNNHLKAGNKTKAEELLATQQCKLQGARQEDIDNGKRVERELRAQGLNDKEVTSHPEFIRALERAVANRVEPKT